MSPKAPDPRSRHSHVRRFRRKNYLQGLALRLNCRPRGVFLDPSFPAFLGFRGYQVPGTPYSTPPGLVLARPGSGRGKGSSLNRAFLTPKPPASSVNVRARRGFFAFQTVDISDDLFSLLFREMQGTPDSALSPDFGAGLLRVSRSGPGSIPRRGRGKPSSPNGRPVCSSVAVKDFQIPLP